MHLPFENTSDIFCAMFAKAYNAWHEHSNLYANFHQVPECFAGKHYPVFSSLDSADKININPSKIKCFFIFSEGLRWISKENLSCLPDLRSDCRYVFITGDNFRAEDYALYNQRGEQLNYVNIYFPWFLYQLSPVDFFNPTYNYSLVDDNKFYNFNSEKPVDFISLIGAGRQERIYLYKKIQNTIDRDRYAISFATRLLGRKEIFNHDFSYTPQNCWVDRSVFKKLSISNSVPIDVFNQARLNIVVETQIKYDSVDNFFVTEKTTKALFTGIPFIVYGAKNFMANLRKTGFMTYDSLWSEDYDSLPTYQERADAIVDLINELQTFDWESAIPELERIHYHNLKLLSNRNKIITPAFLNFERQLQEVIHQVECS